MGRRTHLPPENLWKLAAFAGAEPKVLVDSIAT